MRHRDDVSLRLLVTFDLETGAQCSICHCRFMDYWAWAHVSWWGETSLLSIDRPAASVAV